VAKPGTAVAKPGTPVAKPGTPVAKPGTPVAKPGTPVAKPGTPVAKPGTPVAKPGTPVAKPGTPVAKPGTPVAKPGTPVAKPGTPVAKPGTPVAKPGTPVAKPGTPVAKPGAPVAKPGTPVARPAVAAYPAAAAAPGGAIEISEDEYDGDVNPDYIDPLYDAKKGVYWAYFQNSGKFYKLYGTKVDSERTLLDKIKKIKNMSSGASPSDSLRIELEQEMLDIIARTARLGKKIKELTTHVKRVSPTDPTHKIYIGEARCCTKDLRLVRAVSHRLIAHLEY
jgi:hypothetical protein